MDKNDLLEARRPTTCAPNDEVREKTDPKCTLYNAEILFPRRELALKVVYHNSVHISLDIVLSTAAM